MTASMLCRFRMSRSASTTSDPAATLITRVSDQNGLRRTCLVGQFRGAGHRQPRTHNYVGALPVLLLFNLVLASGAPVAAQSCGELGGDLCSQSGGCPALYTSLGQTWDPCNPCCQHQGPSCGEAGGDWCSQTGQCPAGSDSLGQTYDCNPCCRQHPQGQMNFTVYTGGGMSGGNVYANSSVIDNSSGCTHSAYWTQATIRSPSGRSASGQQSGLQAYASLPIAGEFGDYTITTSGNFNCSCGGLGGFGAGETVPVTPVPTSLYLVSSTKTGECNDYNRNRVYEVRDQFGNAMAQAGMTVLETWTTLNPNGCNVPNPQQGGGSTNNQGRFQDDIFLHGAAMCNPSPSCPSCSSTATQTIRVNGYNVGTRTVTWRCDDVTITP